jgi:nucleoid-associated protein YgaU
MSSEDLPVVDANTDALPNSLETPAEGADQLQPEAVVDVPDGQDSEAAALTEQIASTEQVPEEAPAAEEPASTEVATTEPAAGPSMDAPPSMNEMAPPVASTSESSGETGSASYEVQKGDTLMKVAYKVYGDIYQWKKIYEDNRDRIADPMNLVAGTSLRTDHEAQDDDFNGFERYLIKSGDTLGTISGDVYGTKSKWKRLWKENDRLIKDPNRIYAGFTLRYSFTEEDRLERDRKQELQQDAPPLAEAPAVTEEREPSSAQAPSAQPVPQN